MAKKARKKRTKRVRRPAAKKAKRPAAKKAKRPAAKKARRPAGKKITRIKAKARRGLKPRAERIVRTEEGKLYHEIEYVAKERFKKDAMTLKGKPSTFKTVRPGKKKRAANVKKKPVDVRIIIGCLKEDFDPATGMCLRTTAQKMVRRITSQEASRLQRRNPALLVISNPVGAGTLGSSSLKKLGKTYKRFHFTKPTEAMEIWRPKEYPKGFVSIGECEMFKVKKDNGRVVTRRFKVGNRPFVCTTSANKDVYILISANNPRLMKKGLGIPSGTAVQIDYKVPPESGRNKWSSRWYHFHETRPVVSAHKSGKAARISGPKLRVTPRGIVG